MMTEAILIIGSAVLVYFIVVPIVSWCIEARKEMEDQDDDYFE